MTDLLTSDNARFLRLRVMRQKRIHELRTAWAAGGIRNSAIRICASSGPAGIVPQQRGNPVAGAGKRPDRVRPDPFRHVTRPRPTPEWLV